MKRIVIITFFLFAASILKGQDSIYFTNSNVFLELGGAGFPISANYERFLPINEIARSSVRAGLGMFPIEIGLFGAEPRWGPIVPLMVNFIYGRAISLEAGLGLSIAFNKESYVGNDNFIKWYNATLGLRYQQPGRGFFVRLGFTPIITSWRYCQDYMCTDRRSEIRIFKSFGLSIGTRIRSIKER